MARTIQKATGTRILKRQVPAYLAFIRATRLASAMMAATSLLRATTDGASLYLAGDCTATHSYSHFRLCEMQEVHWQTCT